MDCMRTRMNDAFEDMSKRIRSLDRRITHFIEKFQECEKIFIYVADKNDKNTVNDALRLRACLDDYAKGKIFFVARDVTEYNEKKNLGELCHEIKIMFGYREKAVCIIASERFIHIINADLKSDKYNTPDKLQGLYICDEFYWLVKERDKMIEYLSDRQQVLKFYDWLADDASRRLLCQTYIIRSKGNSFENYDPEDYVSRNTDNPFIPSNLVDRISENAVIVIGGAFCDELVDMSIKATQSKFNKIYVFELNRIYAKTLQKNNTNERISIAQVALGKETACLEDLMQSFDDKNSSYIIQSSDDYLMLRSLDDVVTAGGINEKISLICLDMYRANIDAILGAKYIIQRDKPIVSVTLCEYQHYPPTPEKSFVVAKFLKEIVPEYKFILNNRSRFFSSGDVLTAFV